MCPSLQADTVRSSEDWRQASSSCRIWSSDSKGKYLNLSVYPELILWMGKIFILFLLSVWIRIVLIMFLRLLI